MGISNDKKLIHSDAECLEEIDRLLKSHKTDSVKCLFSGKRARSSVCTIHKEGKEEFILNSDMIARLAEDAATAFKKENPEGKEEVISKVVIHTLANGYEVKNVIHQKVKSLELTVCILLLSLEFAESLIKMLITHVKRASIELSSYPLRAADFLFQTKSKEEFIMFLVNEESADLCVKKGTWHISKQNYYH